MHEKHTHNQSFPGGRIEGQLYLAGYDCSSGGGGGGGTEGLGFYEVCVCGLVYKDLHPGTILCF